MKILLVALALGCVNQVKAQTASNVKTTGACSAVVVGNHNSVTCEAMTKDEAKKMAAILSEVRTSNVSLDVILGKLDAILAQIRRNENPNRGITSYDPDGSLRTTTAAGSIDMYTGEYLVFQQMWADGKQHDWQDVIELAQREKLKAPDWLMPLWLAGVAYANLCKLDDAKSSWDDFVTRAGDEPSYRDYVSLARQRLQSMPDLASACKSRVPHF
jgi:hypothetical protein